MAATSKSHAHIKTLVTLLHKHGMALLWRNNRWQVMAGGQVTAPALPKNLLECVARAIAEGHLVSGDDGAFRPSGDTVNALVNPAETPWQRLAQKTGTSGTAYLDAQQVRAAERLRQSYERAHFSSRVTAHYAPVTVGHTQGGSSDNAVLRLTDAHLAARVDLHRALEAVGPELSSMLLKVCCLERGLEEAERALDLPRRSGKAILAMGLSRLARHYGFKPRLHHGGPDRIGHWGADGYRPAIMPAADGPHQP